MKFALIGKNVSYSLSPKIHSILFDLANVKANYEIINTDIRNIYRIVNNKDYLGFNITIPYKQLFNHLSCSEKANICGAVNTLLRSDDKILAYNTDIYGFTKSLEYANIDLNKVKSAIILGTGGVSKAIEYVLQDYSINYYLVSRNKIASNIISYSDVEKFQADILINASPIGMPPFEKSIPLDIYKLKNYKYIMDTAYSLLYTPLHILAKKQGSMFADGLVMLIAQAIEAENIWINNIHKGYENIRLTKVLEILRNK